MEKHEEVRLSDNCKKLVNFVKSAGEIEEKTLIRQLKQEWDAYLENEEARKVNEEKKLAFQKRMKLHRRSLGIIRKPNDPKFIPIREYSPDEIPVPCTDEFQSIAGEAFLKGVLRFKKVGNSNFIYYTGKLI